MGDYVIFSEHVKVHGRPFKVGVAFSRGTNEVMAWIETKRLIRFEEVWLMRVTRSGGLKTFKFYPGKIPNDVWQALYDVCADPVLKMMLMVLTVGEE